MQYMFTFYCKLPITTAEFPPNVKTNRKINNGDHNNNAPKTK